MPRLAAPASTHLRLRVSLIGSEPEIWRLLEVDAELSLAELHDVLQIAFGWREQHLHKFTDHDPFAHPRTLPRIGREPRTWAPTDLYDEPYGDDEATLAESEWSLADAFRDIDGKLYYEYDFGDGWIHLIELVERIEYDRGKPRAVLLEGELRGPLEDSGGIGGYYQKLEILEDLHHPEHEQVAAWTDWVAGPWLPFDPGLVEVDHINAEFAVRFDRTLGMAGIATDASPGHPRPLTPGAGADMLPLVPADAVIVDLLERLPVPARVELRGLLRRATALSPVEVNTETAAAMVEPLLWLLRRAGSDGIRLTKAGRLPPTIVSDAMRELGWNDDWIGKGDREDQVAPVASLHEAARWFGLVRKRNGVLLMTAEARSYIENPLGLWRRLADTFLRRTRSAAERDIATLVALDVATDRVGETGPGLGYDMSGVLFGLEVLGWAGADGRPLSDDVLAPAAYQQLQRLSTLGVFEGSRWRHAGTSKGGRAFARAMLRSPVA